MGITLKMFKFLSVMGKGLPGRLCCTGHLCFSVFLTFIGTLNDRKLITIEGLLQD